MKAPATPRMPAAGRSFSFALALLALGCSDPECPDGFDKIGKVCKRHDAGVDEVTAGDGGSASDGSRTQADGEAGSAGSYDASTAIDAALRTDAAVGSSGDAVVQTDAVAPTNGDGSAGESSAECDDSHPCSMGYSCIGANVFRRARTSNATQTPRAH